jgi:predicted Rossmann fold flavoprotein
VKESAFDVLVIGAGGAGMMCAIQCGRRGRRVAMIDHSVKVGRKILISGGGRCNFTNINTTATNFVSKNPHFAKSALARFTPEDFIGMVKKHKIAFHEKKLGQLFCDESAQNIINMLGYECEKAGAEFILDCHVKTVTKDERFVIETTRGQFTCESLVIATGGLSIPKIGATGFGYQVARQFGLHVVPTAPALDGFNFSDEDLQHFHELAGVSVDATVRCNGAQFRENILFTHTGLSGPASLQASLYWNKGDEVFIDPLPGINLEEWLLSAKSSGLRQQVKNFLAERLPRRFAEKICEMNEWDARVNQLNEKQIKELSMQVQLWHIRPESTVGYQKAEVTRGGVDTDELSSKTMESKKVPRLYFIGEVVDVTGQLGGYNFQWAWASGSAAGEFA